MEAWAGPAYQILSTLELYTAPENFNLSTGGMEVIKVGHHLNTALLFEIIASFNPPPLFPLRQFLRLIHRTPWHWRILSARLSFSPLSWVTHLQGSYPSHRRCIPLRKISDLRNPFVSLCIPWRALFAESVITICQMQFHLQLHRSECSRLREEGRPSSCLYRRSAYLHPKFYWSADFRVKLMHRWWMRSEFLLLPVYLGTLICCFSSTCGCSEKDHPSWSCFVIPGGTLICKQWRMLLLSLKLWVALLRDAGSGK